MEAFFEFIFGNIAFLIVVIGGIVSLIKRANQNQKQPAKNKKIKPFLPQLEDFFEELNKTQENNKQKPVIYAAPEEPLEAPFIPKKVEVEPKHNMVHHNTVNKKKVIDGVIWGEILGPPKSRKKHSYTYVKRG